MSRERKIRERVKSMGLDQEYAPAIADSVEYERQSKIRLHNYGTDVPYLLSIIDEQREAMREVWDVFAIELEYATDAEKAAWEKLDQALAAHSLEEAEDE